MHNLPGRQICRQRLVGLLFLPIWKILLQRLLVVLELPSRQVRSAHRGFFVLQLLQLPAGQVQQQQRAIKLQQLSGWQVRQWLWVVILRQLQLLQLLLQILLFNC